MGGLSSTQMRITDAARLATRRFAWGATRSVALGRPLVAALGAEDEDVRVLAGTFLTRAGKKAEPLLIDALNRRENIPAVLEVLAGIADDTAEREIDRYLDDPDPAVVEAAVSARRVVSTARSLEDRQAG
jgi:hypothetical protein